MKLYGRLGTKDMYRMAKSREKLSKDFKNIWYIKDNDRRMVKKDKKVIKR